MKPGDRQKQKATKAEHETRLRQLYRTTKEQREKARREKKEGK